MYFYTNQFAIARGTQRFFGWPFLLVTWLAFGLGVTRTEISRNEGDAFHPD
jgi:hypothetical protein